MWAAIRDSGMRSFLLATASLAVLAVSACASNKPVSTPNVALPAAFSQPGQATVALDHWWTSYNDPELTKLVEGALATAPDARLIEQRLIEARATRSGQIYSAYPTGNLVTSVTHGDTKQLSGGNIFSVPGGNTNYNANFDVSWEVDLFGRTRTARRAVDNNYAATRFNIEASRASLAASVADSLFAIRGLAQQLIDAKESQRIASNLNNAAQIRLDHGFGAKLDVDRTGTDLAQANATIVQTQSDLTTNRRTLLVLLGRGGDAVDSIPANPVTYAPPAAPTELPSQLLERRPDVRQAEQQLYLAIAQLKIDRLALFPKLTILPGIGITRLNSVGLVFDPASPTSFTTGPVSSTTSNWSIGGNLSIPVLNRPQLLQTAKVSGAKAEEAVIAYEKAVQTAFSESESALVNLDA
ncbi:MAG: efflux system, outer rane lipoprotein NodT family, partial [Caulobacteraceae bacterium]|nr:efflux system, outer rane lipoprotein NodT family [Caulobacteraceae bacterium]